MVIKNSVPKIFIKQDDEAKLLLKEDSNLFSTLVDIHLKSFHDDELSSILGYDAVSNLYKNIIFSNCAHISLFFCDNKLCGFMIYFKNYSKFKSKIKIKNLISLTGLFKLIKKFSKVINHFVVYYHQSKIPKKIYNNYLGAIAIQSEDKVRLEIFKTLISHYEDVVHKYFKDNCWGSCRKDNKAASLILEKCGLSLKGNYGWNPKVSLYVPKSLII